MAGAGLRLNELYAGEGERGLLLRGENLPQRNLRRVKPWVPLHRSREYFATQRGEGQSKNSPGPFSCLGATPRHLARRGC